MTPKAFNKAMGAIIRKERQARGWSMRVIADQMGYAYQQQQRYEVGRNGLSAFLLGDIAECFGTTVAELYKRAGIQGKAAKSSPADDDAYLAARYVSKIRSGKLRRNLIDFIRKCAYEGNAA
jgi:transcriptional regulator with XRE-family HTH domain